MENNNLWRRFKRSWINLYAISFSNISLKQYDKAEEWAQKALTINDDKANEYMVTTNAFVALGNIYMEQADYVNALDNYTMAERSYRGAGNPLGDSVSAIISDMKNDARNKTLDNGS